MFAHELPERSPRFVEALGSVRMRCECCERPTLPLAEDHYAEVDFSGSMLGCSLCGWENRPADENGHPVSGQTPEDRNDGVSLNDAKDHFARYAWMYDPAHPPDWFGAPMSDEERQLRERLRDAYPGPANPAWDLRERWKLVAVLEEALTDLVAERQRQFEAGWDPGDDAT